LDCDKLYETLNSKDNLNQLTASPMKDITNTLSKNTNSEYVHSPQLKESQIYSNETFNNLSSDKRNKLIDFSKEFHSARENLNNTYQSFNNNSYTRGEFKNTQ